MSEHNKKERNTKSLTCSNYVTRKLICGSNSSIVNQLQRKYGVSINAKNSKAHVIEIKGAKSNTASVEHVYEILQILDQKASVIANQNDIQTTGLVTKEHWGYIASDLNITLKDKAQPSKAKPKKNNDPQNLSNVFDNITAQKSGEEKSKSNRNKPIKFSSSFEPRNLSQAITHSACTETRLNTDGSSSLVNSYVFAAGPFGGGKTFTPLRAAFEVYSQGLVSEIILIRPSTTTSKHNPGAMPGNPRQKIDPYIKGGVGSNIAKIVDADMQKLEKDKIIRVLTPEFERGETYDHAFILVDEPQNLTIEQAELLIGRLGEGSIMVFAGDIGGSQNDIRGQMPGLAHLIATQGYATKTNKILADKTAFIRFTDEDSAARNGILPHVSHALRNPPDEYAAFLRVIQETRQDGKLAEAIDNARKFGERTLTEIAEITFRRYEKQIASKFPHLLPKEKGNVTEFKPRGAMPA